eukprot:Platyproteum_vivax@DN3168_c0_g1_i1.p1
MEISVPKDLTPYMTRAKETEQQYPYVAFFSLVYIAQELLRRRSEVPSDAKEMETTINKVLAWAEKIKPNLAADTAIRQQQMETFALEVFAKAEKEEQTCITKATMLTWISAALFLKVCTQFHDKHVLPPDLAEKETFAKYRATYIKKCFDEGTAPIPAIDPLASKVAAASLDGEAPPLAPPTYPSPHMQDLEPAPAPKAAAKTSGAAVAAAGAAGCVASGGVVEARVGLTRKQINEAQKACQQAASCLNFDDMPNAIQRIQSAYQILTGIQL